MFTQLNYTNAFFQKANFDELRTVLKHLPNTSIKETWVCGGAVLSAMLAKPISGDIDFYFQNKEAAERFRKQLEEKSLECSFGGYGDTYYLPLKDTMYKIHVCQLEYNNSIISTLGSFDFTVCQFGYAEGWVYFNEVAIEHLRKRQIHLWYVEYPVNCIERMIKYGKKGFHIERASIKALLQTLGVDEKHLKSPSFES